MRGVKNNFLVVLVVLLLCLMPVVSAGLFDWFTGTGKVVGDCPIMTSECLWDAFANGGCTIVGDVSGVAFYDSRSNQSISVRLINFEEEGVILEVGANITPKLEEGEYYRHNTSNGAVYFKMATIGSNDCDNYVVLTVKNETLKSFGKEVNLEDVKEDMEKEVAKLFNGNEKASCIEAGFECINAADCDGRIIDFYDCGGSLSCCKYKNSVDTVKEDMEKEVAKLFNGNEKASCQGCLVDDKCLPIGYRKGSNFCSEDGSLIGQLVDDATCNNNHECSSNLCIDSSCVEAGLWKKIMNWFSRIF